MTVTSSPEQIKGGDRSLPVLAGVKRSRPLLVFVKQTFQRMTTVTGTWVKLGVLSSIPVIVAILFAGPNFASLSAQTASMRLDAALIFPLFLWSLGIGFALAVGSPAATQIAEDLETHRGLMLIGKPLSRKGLYAARFLGAYLHSMTIGLGTIGLAGLLSVFLISSNIDQLLGVLPFLGGMAIYCTVISLFFAGVGVAFSALSATSRRASMIMTLFSLGIFLGPYFLRVFAPITYVDLQLYHVDLAYQLGNVLMLIISGTGVLPGISTWQDTFNLFTNVFVPGSAADSSQGIDLYGLQATNYYLPWVSLLYIMGIAVALLCLGYWKFSRREII